MIRILLIFFGVLIIAGCGTHNDDLRDGREFIYVAELNRTATLDRMHLGPLIERRLYLDHGQDVSVSTLGVSHGSRKWFFIPDIPQHEPNEAMELIEAVLLEYVSVAEIVTVRPLEEEELAELTGRPDTRVSQALGDSDWGRDDADRGGWIWVSGLTPREGEFLLAHLSVVRTKRSRVTAVFELSAHHTFLRLRLPGGALAKSQQMKEGVWLQIEPLGEVDEMANLLNREGIEVLTVDHEAQIIFAQRSEGNPEPDEGGNSE
jgi:hypothetical protein